MNVGGVLNIGNLLDRFEGPILLRRFGWAFLLAWVFCVFYTNAVDGYTGGHWIELGFSNTLTHIILTGLPVFSSIVMLVIIVFAEKRLGAPVAHPALFWLAPLLTALSTPLMFANTGETTSTVVLFVCGALLTGVGSGFMWVMWGEYYAKISQADVEFLAPISAIVAALLVLVVSSMSGWMAVAVVTVFPLCSGFAFMLSWKGVVANEAPAEHQGLAERQAYRNAHDRAKDSPLRTVRLMGRIGLGILVTCLFVCVEGSFWDSPMTSRFPLQVVVLASIVLMVVVGVVSTMGPRRIALSFLYRWMCPLMVAGFAALIVFDGEVGAYIAYAISIAARFGFCLITQMFFARYAAMGKTTAVQSFGLGWIFVHLGDFLGIVLFVSVDSELSAGALTVAQVAAVSVAVLVAVTMFVLNDRRSFAMAEPYETASQDVLAAGSVSKRSLVAGSVIQGASAAGVASKGASDAGSLASTKAATPATGGATRKGNTQADATSHLSAQEVTRANAGYVGDEERRHFAGRDASTSTVVIDEVTERIQILAREHELTPREVEVFDLLARGRSIPYIRDALVISKETAATHAKHVYAKLGVHSRQELIDLVH